MSLYILEDEPSVLKSVRYGILRNTYNHYYFQNDWCPIVMLIVFVQLIDHINSLLYCHYIKYDTNKIGIVNNISN